MQKRLETVLALLLAVLTVSVTSLLYLFPQMHTYAFYDAPEEGVYSVLDLIRDDRTYLDVAGYNIEEDTEHQLRLELPSNVSYDSITISEEPIYHTFTVSIPGVESNYVYNYPVVGSSDNIIDFTFDYADDIGILELTMDRVYVLETTSEGSYVYLDFLDPSEVYDALVVVDAGHGGKDGGCNSAGVLEKELNLQIVEKIKDIFDKSDYNIGVYYTRLRDFNPEYEDRVALANDLDADLFLSVHINSTASGRTSGINGSEVMYRSSDPSGASKAFSAHCLDAMLSTMGSSSKGLVAGDEIYIIRTSKVPVALAEIGFITNEKEREKMQSEEYQQKAALALYDAIITTLKENGKL